jgi:hypothetical protein
MYTLLQRIVHLVYCWKMNRNLVAVLVHRSRKLNCQKKRIENISPSFHAPRTVYSKQNTSRYLLLGMMLCLDVCTVSTVLYYEVPALHRII